VRVLCATNRDLRGMIAEDQFREDLYFRVNTFEIRLPPLRERRQDIPDLARHLLARAAGAPVTLSLKKPPEGKTAPAPGPSQPRTLKEIEMEHILRVLEKHNGN